jgi:hypothetical protein
MKGHTNNPYGRPKGSTNKISKEVRALIADVIKEQLPHMKESLEEVRKDSPSKFIELITRLLPYVTPKISLIEVDKEKKDLGKNLPHWMKEE